MILRRTAALGDCLLITPIIRALKRKHPGELIVETDCPQIFAGNPHVAHTSPIQRTRDVAIDLDGSYEAEPARHILESYALAADVQLERAEYRCELYPTPSDHERAERWLPGGRWVAIHAGPNTWPGKMWRASGFEGVIGSLRRDGWLVALVGTRDPTVLPCDADLRGRSTIHQMAAAIARCHLFVGLDSFPLHAAQAMGVPAVGLFGVTLPQYILTSGSCCVGVCADPSHPMSGIRHRVRNQTFVACESNPMDTITVDAVLAATERFLE